MGRYGIDLMVYHAAAGGHKTTWTASEGVAVQTPLFREYRGHPVRLRWREDLSVRSSVRAILRLRVHAERPVERDAQVAAHATKIFGQSFVRENAINNDPTGIRRFGVFGMIHGKVVVLEELFEAEPAPLAEVHHVVVREGLVPGVPLDAELEVGPPDVRPDSRPDLSGRDVVEIAVVVPRDVWLDLRQDRRENVERPAVLRQEDLDARPRGLESLHENEAVLVGNNDGVTPSAPVGCPLRSTR